MKKYELVKKEAEDSKHIKGRKLISRSETDKNMTKKKMKKKNETTNPKCND